MAAPSKLAELEAAWRALSGDSFSEGWSTIIVGAALKIPVRAGRHFPGNEEALLLSFRAELLPAPDRMPSGKGFVVAEARLSSADIVGRSWVAIRRMQSGSQELFSRMAADVLDVLARLDGASEPLLVKTLLQRVRAWQDFMSRSSADKLSNEEEVGLVGELQFLRELLRSGMEPAAAIDAWQGPLDGIHDFISSDSAVEVKATLASGGFRVRISSLEQLDSLVFENVHLFAVRLVLAEKGMTLPEYIASIHELVGQADITALESRVLAAGFRFGTEDLYTRRFFVEERLMFKVGSGFPRLSRANVPAQVLEASYMLDIDQLRSIAVDPVVVIREFGVH